MGSSKKARNNSSGDVSAAEKKTLAHWILAVCVAEAVVVAILALLVAIPAHIPYPTSSDEDASGEKAIRAAIAQAESSADKPGSTIEESLQYYESALKRSPDAIWASEIKRRYEKGAREALAKFSLAFETFIAEENYTQAQTELDNFSARFKDCEICAEQIAAMRARLSLLVEAAKEYSLMIEAAENLRRNERAGEALELLSSFPARYQDTVYAARVKTKKDEIAAYLAQIAAVREAQEKRRQAEEEAEKAKEEAAELQRREEAQKRWIEDEKKRIEEECKRAEEEKRRAEEEARAKGPQPPVKQPEKEEGEPWTVVEMKPFSQNEFPFITPFPTDSTLVTGPGGTVTLKFLPLPNEGRKFQHAVEDKQSSIEVDTDADGILDTHLPPSGGIITVKVFYGKEEGDAPYTVQIFRLEGGLRFRRHSFTAGKFQNTKLFLIDEDNNGKFNDYGTDALVVGNNTCACTLANVMMIGGKLFEVKITLSGKKLSLRPFTAKKGKLNLVSGFNAKGNLLYAIVLGKTKDEKGKEFIAAFDLAGQVKGADIPVGTYELHAAAVGSTNRLTARIMKTKECKEITIAESSSVKIDWGAPARAEFSYDIDATGNLRVNPDSIRIYGAYGEFYSDMGINEFLFGVQVKNENGDIVLTGNFIRTQDGESLETFEALVPANAKLKVRVFGKIGFLGDVSSKWK
jgi:hypothetical protein